MLWNIYLATTAFSWIVTSISAYSLSRQFKREGYQFKERKDTTFSEKAMRWLSIVVRESIPLINILDTMYTLYTWEGRNDRLIATLLKEGKIYRVQDEQTNHNCAENSASIKETKSFLEDVPKRYKTYEEMSREEKYLYLEQEKERLMKQDLDKPVVLKK